MDVSQGTSSTSPNFLKAGSSSQDASSSSSGGIISTSTLIPGTLSNSSQSSTATIPTTVMAETPFNSKANVTGATLLQQQGQTTQFPQNVMSMSAQMPGNLYTSPFHPNFLNPSFLQAAASMQGITKSSTPISGPSFGASGLFKFFKFLLFTFFEFYYIF